MQRRLRKLECQIKPHTKRQDDKENHDIPITLKLLEDCSKMTKREIHEPEIVAQQAYIQWCKHWMLPIDNGRET